MMLRSLCFWTVSVILITLCCSASTDKEVATPQVIESDATAAKSAPSGSGTRDRSGDSRGLFKELVKGALVLAGNSVLGPNMTSALRPLARPIVDRLLPEDGLGGLGGPSAPLNPAFGQPQTAVAQQPAVAQQALTTAQQAQQAQKPAASCTTPQLGTGECRDLSSCPHMLFDLSNLRNSICFQSLFVPGVCCPSTGASSGGGFLGALSPQAVPGRPPVPTRPVVPTRPSFAGPVSPALVRPPAVSQPQRPVRPPPRPIAGRPPPQTRPPPISVPSRPVTPQQRFPCGQPQAPQFRVVGGDVSRPGQWPWMAAIYLHGKGRKEYWCGGSLISSQYIMTAAHCTKDSKGKSFHPRQFTVRLGDTDLSSTSEASATTTYRVTEYVAHPEFKLSGYYNDIALFKLDRPVDFNEYTIPVCLPDQYEGTALDSLVGRTSSVIGWGVTAYGGKESPQLRSAELPVWSQKGCDDAYFQPIKEMFICAGYADGRKDACQGDSGGPLVYFERGSWMQVGIVSFGNRCAQAGYPGVYTRVTNFLPWIRQNIRV